MRVFAVSILLLVPSTTYAQDRCAVDANSPQRVVVEKANKDVVRRFHDALNKQDWPLMESLVAPGYRHFVPSADGFRTLDWSAFKRGNSQVRTAFPDWKNEIVQSIAEGDRVAVMIIGRGTHKGGIAGETASRRIATLPIMIIHQVCAGKLVSDWEMVDVGPMMARLKAP